MEADQYRVVWTRSAQRRLRAIVAEILDAAPSRAIPFGRKLELAAAALCRSPFRCAVTPEDPAYRQLIVKRYRVIYHVSANEVVIDTIVFPYQVFRPELL